MDGREQRIYEEAAALWRELHRDGAPEPADPATILDMITQALPEAPYMQLCSPWLRASNVTFPKRTGGD